MDRIDENIHGLDQALWSSLRACQQLSVQNALLYTQTPFSEHDNKSCLISLPTGAGKSGVIAVLAHHVNQSRILVLCHRRAVCDQLAKEINGGFFMKTCPAAPIQMRPVFRSIENTDIDGIFVTTFQMLNGLSSERLSEIKQVFDLIIIDEGHSEPSPVWRTLVRGTSAHKIVITATPYRNDLFQFDVSPTASYVYTFSEALVDQVLSEPTFATVAEEKILQSVLDFLDEFPSAKCIVKCKSFEKVEYFFNLFDQHIKTIAIHQRYTNDIRDNVKTAVPKALSDSPFRVLVHQHKLDEGVDIPAAKLMVLTYPLGSGRELVQTVGRVVRTFDDLHPIVLEFDHPTNFAMWSNYRDFDSSLRSVHGVTKFLASLNTGRLIELYLDAFPDFSYHENRFVGKFDINSFDPDAALSIPTASICFLHSQVGFSLPHAADTLYWRATNQGELCKVFHSNSTEIIIVLSVAFSKSRFLSNEIFFEPSLEIVLLRQLANGIVAVFDSRGRTYSSDAELKFGSPLEQNKLLKVMTRGASIRPKEASTRSINSARRRPEAMVIKGQNLDDIGGQQQFAAYRMSTIKCDTLDNQGKKSGSYYVGVDAGRISDHKDRQFSLADLDEWFEMIETCLASDAEASGRMLNSFSKPIMPTDALVVESVVFDFSIYENPIEFLANEIKFELDNDFLYYSYDAKIDLSSDNEGCAVKLNIIDEYPYVEFVAESNIGVLGMDENLGFNDFLTRSLHKILFKDGITYAGGRFYELRLPTQDGFIVANSELSGVLVAIPDLLRDGLTEKGHVDGIIQTSADEFSVNSVFHLIDKLKNYSLPDPTISDLGPFYSHIGAADFILCSDMGTEPADFVISSPEKLVYVHVKCGTSAQRPQSSAGALAEVGSQATKNLEMLISGDRNLKAANWTNLLADWPEPTASQRLANRIRLFEGRRFDSTVDALEPALERLWAVIAARRRSVGVRKEVWIIAANSFSISDFEIQMRLGAGGRSESLQAYQLLQGWMSAASNLDAEVKIFVSR